MSTQEGAMDTVDSVTFGFLTDEEAKKLSFVKIVNSHLLDSIGIPITGGLYDPSMGPYDDHAPCKSCGQRAFQCPGHFGHIELVTPVYNPLLFDLLHTIVQSTCFFCQHFRAPPAQVEKCFSELKDIVKGDVVGVKKQGLPAPDEKSDVEDNGESTQTCSMDSSGAQNRDLECLKQDQWTSLPLYKAISVLENFLKKKYMACNRCEGKNPKVAKPYFGWFTMSMPDSHAKANVIKGSKLEDSLVSDASDISSGRKLKRGDASTEFSNQKKMFSGPLFPSKVKEILKGLWDNEAQLCSFITNIQQHQDYVNKAGYSIFFLDTILVPPIKFRPPSKGGDSVMEHPQTVLLSKVLISNKSLGYAHENSMERSKIVPLSIDLQQSISVLYDSKKASGKKETALGICQLLEKKEGIFRQKMMGKRVNFACRSVISPDPYLAVNEIGIPPYFATRLTYPERVTPWNAHKLRDAVINGPEIHPGATHYADKSSTLLLRQDERARISVARKLQSSRGSVTQPSKNCEYDHEEKFVYRHVQDGDIVLVNRQPTLHKPSIMAHRVRVLKGEKTLRMHYANCSTYNADFDGDEMNVHLPQDEISRAEAYNIVNANNQYIVPTRGEPLRGLIQDHIISAVLLTMKDTFLTRAEYNQLLYSSGVSSSSGPVTFVRKPGQKVCIVSSEDEMVPQAPSIIKPKPLWTGKQVITALLTHITKGFPPFTLEKEGKLPSSYFKGNANKDKKPEDVKDAKEQPYCSKGLPGEEIMHIHNNDLVYGVIDKAQFGKYGLVHTVHELYGPSAAGNLLTALSRLFTNFLQIHGFTCGVDDLLLLKHRDSTRKTTLETCDEKAIIAHCELINLKPGDIGLMEVQMKVEKAIRSKGESATARLDGLMRAQLSALTNEVNENLFPGGLLKPFPGNCFSLMTTTGAKGSGVNFQQVSSLLGQQELEGKRVPRMVSGKTLPCFQPWDMTSRSGGYITDNFLTGLRPQEYYFHCMAGREGLVDTAVKTSRSGYLQRCLVKNLESLKVCYDHTVRDLDGSIVQFMYGEDGLDVHKTGFIEKFETLTLNNKYFHKKIDHQEEKFNSYIVEMPPLLKCKANQYINDVFEKRSKTLESKKQMDIFNYEDFMKLVEQRYFSSLTQPGEPVGVIAAQSVGEPSTQMTLNTFHLAGRGEMNVTLGIPRLQEIIMTASNEIKTPIMTCPLRNGSTKDDANALAATLKKVTLADIIESIKISLLESGGNVRIYKLKISLYKPEIHPPDHNISLKQCRRILQSSFMRVLEDAIQNHLSLLSKISGIKNFSSETLPKASSNDTNVDDSSVMKENNDEDDDDDDDDLGLYSQKQKQQTIDDVEYEDDGSEDDVTEKGTKDNDDEVNECDAEDGTSEIVQDDEIMQNDDVNSSQIKSANKKTKRTADKKGQNAIEKIPRKDYDRSFFVSAKGSRFEAHFKFDNEPHVLLDQIAQKAANKVHLNNSGKIDHCNACHCGDGQVIYYGEDPRKRETFSKDELKIIPALQTAGLDFNTFWKMQDDLDIRYVYSNNIYAMLTTYGVEAARESIIREIQTVFGSYGVTVDPRHLNLIADYMTHAGGYRPMSRNGGIAESISPFNKISFETAAKFIKEAAFHGLTDKLESPSARICLGLPVKLGTGCFDVMQQLEI